MTNSKQSVVMVLRQLLAWYDRDESDDDELERIVAQARGLVQRSDSARQRLIELGVP